MKDKDLIIEKVFNAPVQLVWQAITEKDLMKQWYFELDDFKPEVGFKFQFHGQGLKGQEYLHKCQVIEMEPLKKLKYSWAYEGYEGYSTVTFELSGEGTDQTKLKLIHEGLETFPTDNPDFNRQNFVNGWEYIVNTALKDFLESNYRNSILVNISANGVYNSLTEHIPDWWTQDFNGFSQEVNNEFTVRFGTTFKTMRINKLIPNEKVVWTCIDTLIDIPGLQGNTEWKDTIIVWNIGKDGKDTKISLMHIGLTPQSECYEVCEKGWVSFLESLGQFLETGTGTPYKKK